MRINHQEGLIDGNLGGVVSWMLESGSRNAGMTTKSLAPTRWCLNCDTFRSEQIWAFVKLEGNCALGIFM